MNHGGSEVDGPDLLPRYLVFIVGGGDMRGPDHMELRRSEVMFIGGGGDGPMWGWATDLMREERR